MAHQFKSCGSFLLASTISTGTDSDHPTQGNRNRDPDYKPTSALSLENSGKGTDRNIKTRRTLICFLSLFLDGCLPLGEHNGAPRGSLVDFHKPPFCSTQLALAITLHRLSQSPSQPNTSSSAWRTYPSMSSQTTPLRSDGSHRRGPFRS